MLLLSPCRQEPICEIAYDGIRVDCVTCFNCRLGITPHDGLLPWQTFSQKDLPMLANSPEGKIEPMNEDAVASEFEQSEVLEQLERIASSSLFRNSKRYPSLLRYIVGEALARRSATLKERALGIDVFGRDPDYDTNADPVVRISAGEVRKRIAQYYQERGHQHELRIEIPLGSYQPRFYRPSEENGYPPAQVNGAPEAAVEAQLENHKSNATHAGLSLEPAKAEARVAERTKTDAPERRRLSITRPRLHLVILYSLLFLALIPLALFGWRRYQSNQLQPGAAFFWGRILRSPAPTLIVLGVHSFDAQGNDISYVSHVARPQTEQTLLSAMTRSDMIQLSDLTSFAGLATLLTRHTHSFYTQGATDTTLEQLRRGPFVLVGGFNNLWTTTITSRLRFRFIGQESGMNFIQDSRYPERTWTLDPRQKALSNTRDYGMVAAFFDPETNQQVLIVAGIGKSGTEAASDFLTNEQGLTAWLQSNKAEAGDNVQVIISTDVIEGEPGAPQVVASARW
jgi:hypothetical protein